MCSLISSAAPPVIDRPSSSVELTRLECDVRSIDNLSLSFAALTFRFKTLFQDDVHSVALNIKKGLNDEGTVVRPAVRRPGKFGAGRVHHEPDERQGRRHRSAAGRVGIAPGTTRLSPRSGAGDLLLLPAAG